jgi:hypothetical protein
MSLTLTCDDSPLNQRLGSSLTEYCRGHTEKQQKEKKGIPALIGRHFDHASKCSRKALKNEVFLSSKYLLSIAQQPELASDKDSRRKPSKEKIMNFSLTSLLTSTLSSVALNPQPLPPGPPDPEVSSSLWPSTSASNAGTQSGIIIVGGRQFTLDDFCGNGPRPIPHHIGQFGSSE